MRWTRPRFTVRRGMVAVAAIAGLLGLGLPAVDVLRHPDVHVHVWVNPDGRAIPPGTALTPEIVAASLLQVERRPAPFWARYREHLLGRPWLGSPLCTPEPDRIAEACEHEHPDMIVQGGGGVFYVRWTPELVAEARKRDPGQILRFSSPPLTPGGP